MVSFIHTGDLHLGLQFKNVDFNRKIARERRLELWNTFEGIVNRAIEKNVDFLFIAGDLFEERYFTLGDIKRVRDTLKKAENIDVIITAGNHDTLNINSLYHMVNWPQNINIFDSKGLEKKEFVHKKTVVYGYSWDKGENNKDLFKDFLGIDKDKINILIIHGDIFNKNSPYLPLDKNYLQEIGFDYIGLGHIHKPNIISDKMAYCGSPEPLDFGEIGEHGIIEGIIEKGNTKINFVPFSNRMFLEKIVDIDETMGYVGIIDKIKQCDKTDKLKQNLYRVKLEGVVHKDLDLNIEDILENLADYFYYIDVIDNTIVNYDLDRLEEENRDNIVGYFIKNMKDKDLKDKVVRDALYIGLKALLKGKVEI
jgi:exonuclease SbcD